MRLTTVWPEITAQDAEDLLAFWKREGAIPDESARRRGERVVMLARDADGEIAGVCTSLPMTPPRLRQPCVFWRAFVGKQWRHTRLIFNLLTRSFSALEDYACGNDYPLHRRAWSWRTAVSAR